MALSRGQYKNLLVPGLNSILGDSYKQFNEQGQHLAIYGEMKSPGTRAYVESLMTATFGPAAEKNEAGAMMLDEGAQEMYKARVTMKTYAIRFNISKELIDDNQYMDPAKVLTRALARSQAERMQLEAVAPINNATSTSFLGGDGKALAVTDHPTKDGGNNSNLLTAADFNEASLEDMVIQTQGWVDQRGKKISANIKKLILPVGYTFIAARLGKSIGRVDTANNDANVHKGFAFVSGGYAINNYLSDTDAWAGITDIENGLVGFQRQKLESFSEMNFETTNMQYGCTQRYAFGWFDPLGIIFTAGA